MMVAPRALPTVAPRALPMVAAGHAETLNACGRSVRPPHVEAVAVEARIPRLSGGECQGIVLFHTGFGDMPGFMRAGCRTPCSVRALRFVKFRILRGLYGAKNSSNRYDSTG